MVDFPCPLYYVGLLEDTVSSEASWFNQHAETCLLGDIGCLRWYLRLYGWIIAVHVDYVHFSIPPKCVTLEQGIKKPSRHDELTLIMSQVKFPNVLAIWAILIPN